MRQPQARLDPRTLVAMGAIAICWFAMATLVVNLGAWQQSIHFYDLLAVINDPAGRLTGINRAHPLMTLGFALVCSAAVLAPVAPQFSRQREAWLSYLAPLILMAFTGAILYAKTSASYLHANTSVSTVATLLARAAQGVVSRTSELVATHISIGAGAYLALFPCAYLALAGVSRFCAARSHDATVGEDGEALAACGQRDAGARQVEP